MSSHSDRPYRGRFAPSPTGPLHFGSLFAAVISYLHARANDGEWVVRIEDLDPPREQFDAKARILNTLEQHGFEWEAPIVYQSERSHLYEQALAKLIDDDYAYRCPCSRKELAQREGRHTEACVTQQLEGKPFAIKYRAERVQILGRQTLIWQDGFQGEMIGVQPEDFVLKRKEGLYAYQLAVVCDDLAQDISHVVRGYDLLDSTPMQLAIYNALGQIPPHFSHFPVIVNQNKQKLSKQNLSPAVDDAAAIKNLLAVLSLLNIDLPDVPRSPKMLLEMATEVWRTYPPDMLRRQQVEIEL